MIEEDDEERLKRPLELTNYGGRQESDSKDDNNPQVADWRYGPAQLWYDMLNVPENGEGFDYGFKVNKVEDNDNEEETYEREESLDPDDAYHMVTQIQWENDIIWNGDELKQKILAKLNDKNHAAGWVPSGVNRTASAFTQHLRGSVPPAPTISKPTITTGKKGEKKVETQETQDDTWYSIFPVENEELVYGCWEVCVH
jgi:transcription initiation factor TFIID subunit 1